MLYELMKLIRVFQIEKYGVWVWESLDADKQILWYLEITDCESVKIWTEQFLGAVIIAERIASISALKEHGQSLTCAWNELIVVELLTWTQPMPIEHWEVPRLMTEPSV